LNLDPTREQLRQLIAQGRDRDGHHLLWVSDTGEVQLSLVPADLTPAGFQQAHPQMRLRYEMFERGNEYVGPSAAADDAWVYRLFESLVREWPRAKDRAAVEYIDLDRLTPEEHLSGPPSCR
jgi:hypothetical protein